MTAARRGTATAAAVAVLGVLASSLLALVAMAAPAEAAAYRYWTYWWGKPGATSWTFANLGPAGHKVADRSVEGWRFEVSTTTGDRAPRTSASWEDQCSDTAETGMVRVALVIDFGTTADAPPGQTPPYSGSVYKKCLVVPAGTTGATLLQDPTLKLNPYYEKGLLCSLLGYPKNECAAIVADPTPTPTRTSSSPKPTPSASTAPSTTSAGGAGTARPSTSASRSSAAATSSAPAAATTTAVAPTTSDAGTAPPGAEPTLPVSSGPPVAAAPADAASGPAGGFVVGALVAVAIGGAAWWTARGRSA